MTTFYGKVELRDGDGHAILYLRGDGQDGIVLLQIRDGEEGSTGISENAKYWVEWHFWSTGAASYILNLNGPECPPFPVEGQTYNYDNSHDDYGAFSFIC